MNMYNLNIIKKKGQLTLLMFIVLLFHVNFLLLNKHVDHFQDKLSNEQLLDSV